MSKVTNVYLNDETVELYEKLKAVFPSVSMGFIFHTGCKVLYEKHTAPTQLSKEALERRMTTLADEEARLESEKREAIAKLEETHKREEQEHAAEEAQKVEARAHAKAVRVARFSDFVRKGSIVLERDAPCPYLTEEQALACAADYVDNFEGTQRPDGSHYNIWNFAPEWAKRNGLLRGDE